MLLILVELVALPVSAQDASRYPLLTIEQNRASVVKAIVDRWSNDFVRGSGEAQRTPDQLGNELWALRSDRLLAASLAGTAITVRDLLLQSRQERHADAVKPSLKALGDVGDDLVFTPVTPCRIVDSRNALGPLQPETARIYAGFGVLSTFASQGGVASSCNVPLGVAALALNVAAVQPSAAGFITLYPADAARPLTSMVNYAAGDFATATGTVVRVNSGDNNTFVAWSPAVVDIVIDVAGYFRRPTNYVGTSAASAMGATVAGGENNIASGINAFVGGGFNNIAGGATSTVSGGSVNNATATSSTVAGGTMNAANGPNSAVGGGSGNVAVGALSAIGGGFDNRTNAASAAIAGGSGNRANGNLSFVAGGADNTAGGTASFAAGTRANAAFNGCVVFADAFNANVTSCGGVDEFVARAHGGFYFLTGGTSDANYTGAQLAAGAGAWTTYSDRVGKDNLQRVDARAVLRKVATLPLATWNWKSQGGEVRHMGPMAQDFHAAFGLGETPKGISTVDADGVALAAIQGLDQLMHRKTIALRRQGAEIAALKRELAAIKARLGL